MDLKTQLMLKKIPNASQIETIVTEFTEKTGKSPNILLLPYSQYDPNITWVYGMEVGLTAGEVAIAGKILKGR